MNTFPKLLMMSIEFEAVLRNAISFLTRTALVTHIPASDCEKLVTRRRLVWQDYCSTLGGNPNAERFAHPGSCLDFFDSENWLQESVHRHGTARNLTQANGKLERCLSASGKKIAQMGRGAVGSLGELLDRHSGAGGPAKHGMWF